MAILRTDLYSQSLDMDTSLVVILPQDEARDQEPPRVLYLLHGLSNNCMAWLKHTSIVELAIERNFAVVMPEVQRSFYSDMAHGLPYFRYVAKELPELCETLFGLSRRREDNFIAGLSMGGYGAAKFALTNPEQYAACASFSGCVDILGVSDPDEKVLRDIASITGGAAIPLGAEHDLFALTDRALEQGQSLPRMLLTCGTEDFLHEGNQKFRTHLSEQSVPFTYREWAGEHNWKFWRESLLLAFDFFDGKELP